MTLNVTDGQIDGIAVANTALCGRAVKMMTNSESSDMFNK